MLGEKIKKFLKIGVILIFVFILIFGLVKTFILKPPAPPPPPPQEIPILSPEEVVIKYFSLEQEGNRKEAKKYLFSDLTKVKVFGQDYPDLSLVLWAPWKSDLPDYKVIDVQILENEAKIAMEVTTNRIQAMSEGVDYPIFFSFDSPRKIDFEVQLIKEEKYWKITKIDLPDLILERKLGEKVEIVKDVFIRPIRIEKYSAKEVKPPEGFKFLSLEVEYENKKAESLGFYFYSFADWRIIDENQIYYKPIFNPLNPIEVPAPVPEMGPNETKRIYVFFEVPEDISLRGLIFQNLDKKIIFKIE